MKKAFYDKAEFEFDFVITDEQVEPATLVQNTQTVLMAVSQNPAILQDPRIKMLFYKYAEILGVSPAEIEMADNDAQDMPAAQQLIQPQQQPQQPAMQPQQ
jgi:hypothetical protein